MKQIWSMPLPFFLTCIAIAFIMARAWKARRQAWGLPACAVLGTVTVWYVVDVFYNNYEIYQFAIGPASLTSAWWQVLWFVVAFGLFVKPICQALNGPLPERCSYAQACLDSDLLRQPEMQRRIDLFAGPLLIAWILLMIIAVIQVKGNLVGLFAPYLGFRADPWARGQIGGGFSALISLASYLQIFLTAAFGVVAAVALNPKTRNIALTVCFLALPYFIFDRTRNAILATMLPGILAFVFFRLRSNKWIKLGFLIAAFIAINAWFTFVMASRGAGVGVSRSFASAEIEQAETLDLETKHLGLNMFEELAWIDRFLTTGRYQVNWGQRYFAELVNPIPRGLWKNKPLIGLDYAVARGQAVRGAKGEVTATISTGMIGQGVVNFGRFLGPLAAAILMGLWVALLVRQDLKGNDPARLILYGCGLILTFNMGRDITLLVLYPFLFGLLGYWFWETYIQKRGTSTSNPRPTVSNDAESPY